MPQNIDMQDRIIGPLTMIQFLYAVFGGGFAYISINSFPSPLNWGVAILIAIFTICIIFVKVNERPFLQFLGDFLLYLFRPKVQLWSKSDQPVKIDVYQNQIDQPHTLNQKNVSKDDLRRLSELIDSHNSVER